MYKILTNNFKKYPFTNKSNAHKLLLSGLRTIVEKENNDMWYDDMLIPVVNTINRYN